MARLLALLEETLARLAADGYGTDGEADEWRRNDLQFVALACEKLGKDILATLDTIAKGKG